jgi:hypothetical protein
MTNLNPNSKSCVNYKVLYAAMGYEISPAEEEAAKKSLGHALTVRGWPGKHTKVANTLRNLCFARIDP